MASPTTNKGMTWPVHGGGVGTWDGNLNANFEIIDLSFGGYYQITASSTTAAVTFGTSVATIPSTATSITFSASLGTNLFYNLTGARSQNLSINMPAVGSFYIFANNSSGTTTTTVLPTGGSGVTLPQGGQVGVVTTSTGANYVQNVFGAITALSIAVSSAVEFTGTNKMGVPKGTTAQRPGSPVSGDVRYNSTLNGLEYYNGSAWVILGQAPTVQRLISGTGATYTPVTGVTRIRVRMAGPGGGGGARTTNNGSNGSGATIFGSWSAGAGNGGATTGGSPGSGGSGGGTGTGTLITRFNGAPGNTGCTGTAATNIGGSGGVSPFGGAGNGTVGAPTAAVANTGSGGGGPGGASVGASGGGAGEYVEFWVNAPTATTYTIGTGGAGGTAGVVAGGAGASGVILIEEFYD